MNATISYLIISALEVCAAVFTGTLLLGSLIGRQFRERRDRLLLSLMLVNIIMLLCDAWLWYLRYAPNPLDIAPLKRLTLAVDALSFVTAALYAYYLTASVALKAPVSMRYARVMLALCALGTAVCAGSLFGSAYLWFDEAGVMHYGVLYPYFILFSFVLLMMETLYPLWHVRSLGLSSAVTLASYGVVLLVASPLQMTLEAAPILLANTLTLTLIYAVTHGELGMRVAEQKEQLLKAQLESEQARISVMLSQIQPHFMFNVLNTIYHLCEMDAGLAQQAVGDFSEYLRGNLNALQSSGPVPFEVEMRNVRSYLSLEKLRFEEELHIIYDIQTTAFMLPMLTVQPMVENAVKHGICKKPGGGMVAIAAHELDEEVEITITDDGVGFDPDARQEDGRKHIGISATRQRLSEMCGGTLTIVSSPGGGTRAVIRIPQRSTEEEQI